MRKQQYGRRLKRDIKERKALFRTLMREMVIRGQMKTTEAKAKSIKPELEKMVTKAKNKSEGARYDLMKTFNKQVSDRIITDIAPKFHDRPGGYTRIIKLGKRTKDSAPMVLMQWVESVEALPTKPLKRSQKKQVKAVKTTTAAATTTTTKKAASKKTTSSKREKITRETKKAAPKDIKSQTKQAKTQRKTMQSSKGK